MKTWVKGMGLVLLITAAGCGTTDQTVNTKRDAVLGGLIGAGAGAIVGNQSGRGLEGAAIGAAAGSMAGGTWGSAQDEQRSSPYLPQR